MHTSKVRPSRVEVTLSALWGSGVMIEHGVSGHGRGRSRLPAGPIEGRTEAEAPSFNSNAVLASSAVLCRRHSPLSLVSLSPAFNEAIFLCQKQHQASE